MTSLRHDVENFCKNNVVLCALTLGIAIPIYCVGNIFGRLIKLITEPKGTAETTHLAAQGKLGKLQDQKGKPLDPTKIQTEVPNQKPIQNAASDVILSKHRTKPKDTKIESKGKEPAIPAPKIEVKKEAEATKPALGGKPKIDNKGKVELDPAIVKAEQLFQDHGNVKSFKFKYDENSINKTIEGMNFEQAKAMQKNPKAGELVALKKANLLQQMVNLCKKLVSSHPEMTVTKHADASRYILTDKTQPDYFSHKWTGKEDTAIENTGNFFDYTQDKSRPHVYVNFANKHLGGGWNGDHGFVQEEIMAHETPGFTSMLSHLYQNKIDMRTRNDDPSAGNQDGAYGGSPDPILVRGLKRVQGVDENVIYEKDGSDPKKAYGAGIGNLSSAEILERTVPFSAAQDFTMLAIAAPNLGHGATLADKYDTRALKDVFNTLVSGTELAKDQLGPNALFHSGPLGAGVFNNSREVVYLMHRMAKGYTGVNFKLHAYSDKEAAQYANTWDAIAPKLAGQSLEGCMNIISKHLKTRDGLK